MEKRKIIRATTVPLSLKVFLNGTIESLMEKYDLLLVSSPEEELQWMHEKYGVRIKRCPIERHISIIKDLKSLFRLVKIFRSERPFMVHSMTPKAGLLCMIAAWITRVPKRVHTFTGLVWPTANGFSRRVLMFTDWITCACATHIIPEGEGVKNDLQNYISKKPMKVLGYGNVRGVDMDYWKSTDELKADGKNLFVKGKFNYIFVGRLVGDKGINELVEAFCRLHEVKSDIRLILVGPIEDGLDPIEPVTREKINNTSDIIEVGPVWGRDILKYYAASDCFVFPSYREGFPNTVLEAGAMGLPSIVTDINGSREIIISTAKTSFNEKNLKICDNGIIIPPKDIGALYDAMFRMLVDDDMRNRMAENARPLVESRFEQSFVRKCLLDFYDEIT